jgi:hypothetical protein
MLDTRAVAALREVLAGLVARAGIGLTVDLTALDDQHHLTASALLSTAARTMHGHGSTLTARNPPASLTATLAAIPVPITYGQPPASHPSDTQAIQVSATGLSPPATAPPTRG